MNNPGNLSTSLARILLTLRIYPLQKGGSASRTGVDSAAPIAGMFTREAKNAIL